MKSSKSFLNTVRALGRFCRLTLIRLYSIDPGSDLTQHAPSGPVRSAQIAITLVELVHIPDTMKIQPVRGLRT
jgi:hypothetical protein